MTSRSIKKIPHFGHDLYTSVSNSPDSTAMLMSVIIFTRSTSNPGRSAVSTYSKLQKGKQVTSDVMDQNIYYVKEEANVCITFDLDHHQKCLCGLLCPHQPERY